jgi:hypothetical protein
MNLTSNKSSVQTTSLDAALAISMAIWSAVAIFAAGVFFVFRNPPALPVLPADLLVSGSPEPAEQLTIKIAAIWFPIAAFVFLPMWTRIVQQHLSHLRSIVKQIILVAPWAVALCLGIAGLFVLDLYPYFLSTSRSNAYTYLHSTLWWQAPIAAIILYGILVFSGFYADRNQESQKLAHLIRWIEKKGFRYALWIAAPLIIAYTIFPANRMNAQNGYHFDVLFYPVGQAVLGETLLTDGFRTTYGLYAHLFEPFVRVLGGGVAGFTTVCAVLSVLCFLFVVGILRIGCRSNRFVFWGTGATLFWGYFLWKAITGDHYLQFVPLRALTPLFFVWYGARFITRPTNTSLLIGGFGATIGVILNIEFGIIAIGIWTTALAAAATASETTIPRRLSTFAKWFLISILICVAGLAAFYGFLTLRSGKTPDLGLATTTLTVFSKYGIALLPMPLLHPWNLFALGTLVFIFVGAWPFVSAFFSHNRFTPNAHSGALLLLGVLCLWSFGYYGGRSHNLNLTGLLLFFIPALTILSEVLLNQNDAIFRIAAAPALLILCSWIVEAPTHTRMLGKQIAENFRVWNASDTEVQKGIALIQETSSPEEKVIVISKNQGALLGEAKRRAAAHPALTDLFTKTERDALQAAIDHPGMKVYFEDNCTELVEHLGLRISNLKLVKKSGTFSLLQK